MFKGKATIAQIVARDAGLDASWTELSGRTPAATSEALRLLALTIDRPDGPSLLILDDLDTSANARRVYAASLRQLVHRASVAGIALLFTAQGHTEALEQEVATSWGVDVVVVPAMPQPEVAEHCVDFNCSSQDLANAWGQLIAVQSGGHPALVHVRLVELRDLDWPALELSTFVTPSPGTQSAKQMARELLDASVSAEASQFALEAGEFMVAPTREMLLNLAGLPPKLTGAQAVLTTLTGRWLEELGNGRYRITQILRGEVNVTWTAEQHRAVHAKLFDSISACGSIAPDDAGALVFHAFMALDAQRFLLSVQKIATTDAEVQRLVFSHCSWVLHVSFDSGPLQVALKSAMPSLRYLQFLVAEVEDPSRLAEFARAWRDEIGPRVSDAHWTVSRVMYDMTVLSKHVALPMEVVLDAVSSAVQTQQPAASLIAAGLANMKAMPALPGFAFPQSATTFQFFLSLHAGGVRTLRDFNDLLAFLSNPLNQALADQFDEMLDWPHVRDLGAFVHTGWVAEANKDSPDWSPWLEVFDQALAVCESRKLPLYGAQVARAKSIVLSEYAGDLPGGFAVLDRATDLFGSSAVIEEQRINLMGQSDDHERALSAWDETIARFGSQAVTDPFAFRRAAISAAKLARFDRASLLFEQGARQQNEGFFPTRVGLLIDASYCALRAGQLRRCSTLLTDAVLLLPPEAGDEGDKRWEAIIQAANATAQLFENPARLLPDGKPFVIAFGRASQKERDRRGVARTAELVEEAQKKLDRAIAGQEAYGKISVSSIEKRPAPQPNGAAGSLIVVDIQNGTDSKLSYLQWEVKFVQRERGYGREGTFTRDTSSGYGYMFEGVPAKQTARVEFPVSPGAFGGGAQDYLETEIVSVRLLGFSLENGLGGGYYSPRSIEDAQKGLQAAKDNQARVHREIKESGGEVS